MSTLLGIKALKDEFVFQSFRMGAAYPLFAVCYLRDNIVKVSSQLPEPPQV